MRKEIGSEFWDAPVKPYLNSLFPSKTEWFISGRVALRYIIEDIKKRRNVHSVALPSWCCDSIIIPFLDSGIDVSFYPVTVKDGKLNQDASNCSTDILFVMDFFGFGSTKTYESYPGIVIRDLTHSIFTKSYSDANYYFGSLRKWCGIVTGGFAWGKEPFVDYINILGVNKSYVSQRENAMKDKFSYINEKTTAKDYLRTFGTCEQFLDDLKVIQGSTNNDIKKSKTLDFDFLKRQRRKNAAILLEELLDFVIWPQMKEGDCPLFVPVLLENRDAIRKKLIEKEIYCPVHWPISEYHVLSDEERFIYDHELSIVCDQRYSTSDIICEAETLLKGIRE